MDMRSWKKVLLQWITECGFLERTYFNIEQTDIDAFFQFFCLRHENTASDKYKHLGDFLKEFYPNFEFHCEDENCLSSADYVYVYSLLLHYCCVKEPEKMFHEICKRLPDYAQQCIASFFRELMEKDPITKEALQHAIAELANLQITPPRLNDSFSSSASAGGQSSASFSHSESPLKTPHRCAGTQRISPPTPKTHMLEERTKELYNLRAELETERYEKGLLEMQIKQNEDKIENLNHDHKKLLQQIQDLKHNILINNSSDDSPDRDGEENQIQRSLIKQLSQREEEIFKLLDNEQTLREEKTLVEEKLNYAEKEIVLCKSRFKEFCIKYDELCDDLEEKKERIKYLTDSKMELEHFISETRSFSAGLNPDLNASGDCCTLDSSFLRNSSITNSVSSPENLAASVIDVQLKEKENENQVLKEELLNVKREHKRLAKHLTKLTQEFDLLIDSPFSASSENSEIDLEEVKNSEDSFSEDQISCEKEFNFFNSCMEKINNFHKAEKSKISQLEQQTYSLQEENENLNRELKNLSKEFNELTEEVQVLRDTARVKEKLQQELEVSKTQVQLLLEESEIKLEMSEDHKNKLYINIQSLEGDNQKLNSNICELQSQLELQQKECKELLENNVKLNEQEQSLQAQLQKVQKEFSFKTSQWEDELKELSDKIVNHIKDIEMYKKTEQIVKSNYEQMLVQNEELKKEARLANTHLCDIRIELKQKENQLTLLAKEISDFKHKNEQLEQNFNSLMKEHQQEKLTNNTNQTELKEQLKQLKEQLAKTKLLLESKQHECELKQQKLQELQSKVCLLLKLMVNFDGKKEDVDYNLDEIETQIKKLIQDNKDWQSKILTLEETHKEVLTNIQELTEDLNEKSQSFEKAQSELLTLKEDNLASEKKIKQLQLEKDSVIEKSKIDLEQKEKELQKLLREASVEYEASMERIAIELKLEKEHHNNKEMELIVSAAEHNEAKKRLIEAEKNILKLQTDNQNLQQSCERLQQFESKVVEYSDENNKLRQDIENFKKEVTENDLRLLEADKALAEFMELTKNQDTAKNEVEILQNKFQEKEKTVQEMQIKLKQMHCYEEQLQKLQQQLDEQNDLVIAVKEQVEKLSKDKERLNKEVEEKAQQILKEQQNKLLLISSLEKSTDQLKLASDEKQEQTNSLQKKLQELKEEFAALEMQNSKLQGDLVEREAELHLSLDEQQQDKEDFQQKLLEEQKKLSKKSEELEKLDVALIEIVAIMENNFNLSQELLNKDINNVFNYQENEKEKHIQQLKNQLNYVLYKQQQLNQEIKELIAEKEETFITLKTLRESNKDLLTKLHQQERDFKEVKEQLDNEELIMEKRVFHEVKRLEGDLLNLEKVNERLTNENVKMQVTLGNVEQECKDSKLKIENLEEEILKLKEECLCKSVQLEKVQKEEKRVQQTLKEKQHLSDKLLEKSKHFELQLKDKSSKLQNMEKEHQETREKANKYHQKLLYYQQSQLDQQKELNKLQDKYKLVQTSNETLDIEVANKNKELLCLKNKNNEVLQQHKDLEQQLNMTSKKLDEMLTQKLNAETKCEQLQSEVQQLKRDLQFIKSQQQTHHEESSRLNQEIESLKEDKQHLRAEVHESKLSLQSANDNVSQLIQQISSIRLEKEAARDQCVLLSKQLEEIGKTQSSSETKMKTVIEKSQDFERKLLTAENELKSLRVHLEKSEAISEKLQAENKKLRENQENTTKRVEKLALKLGDSQAKSAKFERDNEKLNRTLESHSATVEALQKEKDLLQTEAKSFKERLSRAERGHEQLATKVHNLEHINTSLQQIKQKLEASEIDSKIKLNKLEKLREANEEKIRKLTHSLTNSENANVKLNLEIGALNSQLQKAKVEYNQEQEQQIEELNHKLARALELNQKYEEVNEKLKIEVNTLKEDNSTLSDKISKASLAATIASQKCERFAAEIEQIRADMLKIRQEKSEIQLQHETSIQKLNQLESQNTKLMYERKTLVKSLEQKISHLEEELATKTKQVVDLQKEIKILKDALRSHENTATNLSELEDLRTKLSLAEEIRLKEQQIVDQLRLDNQILHSKYQESKQRAIDATATSEERIKENRLELEGKLEKMKNKMKTLYTEEITKMKTKQEREMAVVKSEMEVLKAQNTKYEEHTRKLSNQIVRLNDNILQYQKENTILSTKLKYTMELQDSERNKRPSSIHVSTISTSTASTGPSIGTNLAMEDEEGEVFNNTYLTDMKNGHTSELMSRDVCVEEIKYRNSLLPPHLRSAYAAQFDHEFPEDELKDGPHSLDDSMSALLSTTANGTRKKCSGITHYKRPGPPTPSKNGRLSFGCAEPAREILKESCDSNGGATVSSSKTPARFNFFASRFSMGGAKDEKPIIKKLANDHNLRKAIQKAKLQRPINKFLTGVGCTSTPRKSTVHYDQRRLVDQLTTSSPSPSPLTLDIKIVKIEKNITPPDVSIIETPVTALDRRVTIPRASLYSTNAKRIEAIAGGLRRNRRNSSMFGRRLSRRLQEICTPTSGDTTSSALSTPAVRENKTQMPQVVSSAVTTPDSINKSTLLQIRLRKKPKREKGARPSLYLSGNIFAKYRTPNKGALQDLIRYKSKKQRLQHFNQGRNLKMDSQYQKDIDKTFSCQTTKNATYDLTNNNYSTFNHNELLGATVVIEKCHQQMESCQANTFTYKKEKDFDPKGTDNLGYVEDYNSESECNDGIEANDGDEEEEVDVKCDVPLKQVLISTQDLYNFDRYVANVENESIKIENKHDDDYSSQCSSEHFEKLLAETESNAPFEVKHSPPNVGKSFRSNTSSKSHRSSFSLHSHSSYSDIHTHSHHKHGYTTVSTATPHLSPIEPNCFLKRTIYGGTVIYSHRLPNINTTMVRKSSIYVKNRRKSSNHHHHRDTSSDVVLITNQTITFVDIMRMWSQMDSSTRLIISFAILASITSLLGIIVSLCSRR